MDIALAPARAIARLGFGPRDTSRERTLAMATILLFWAAYFLFATAKSVIAMLPDPGAMILRRAVVTLVAIGLTMLLWMLLDRLRERPVGAQALVAFGAAVPLALAYAIVNYVAFYAFPIESHAALMTAERGPPTGLVRILVYTVLDWYFFICCWAVLWIALTAGRRAQAADERARRLEALATDAQLTALRYQVNPHFLFNTLNSLSLLVMKDQRDEAEEMITGLADFLRATLTLDPARDVTLETEIALQKRYLDIEQIRFPGRLEVTVEAAPDALRAGVPPLILQPLVENVIKHGVARSTGKVCLAIRAHTERGRLIIEVANDCPASDAPGRAGLGVGLANVAQRLEARHGAAARLVSGAATAGDSCFEVRLELPLVAVG